MMMLLKLLFTTSALFAAPRTVMVQLFEWPWQDVARECEQYLGPAGFSAAQVSPPQEHISLGQNAWWERYQPVSYKIASRSGDENEFRDMVRRCRNAGIDIYVDVVFNHMSAKNGVGFAGSSFEKLNYPGLYSPNDFHSCGRNGNNELKNYNDRFELQFCELLGLADLRTESEYVRNTIADYLNHLLDLGAAGFRIDSAKHIPAEDIGSILSRLKRHAYVISETFIGQNEPVSINEYMPFGDVNFFQYPYEVGWGFVNGAISGLPQAIAAYPDSRNTVVFVENHDLQRSNAVLPSYNKDASVYLMEHVFMLTWPYGYPQVFSGYRFSSFDQGPPVDGRGRGRPVLNGNMECVEPWNCEHRMPGIASLVRFRNETDRNFYATKIWRGDQGELAFSRGNLGFVALNRSSHPTYTRIPTDLADGWYCNILGADNAGYGNCRNYVHVENGQADVRLSANSALVLLASARTNTAPAPRRARR